MCVSKKEEIWWSWCGQFGDFFCLGDLGVFWALSGGSSEGTASSPVGEESI